MRHYNKNKTEDQQIPGSVTQALKNGKYAKILLTPPPPTPGTATTSTSDVKAKTEIKNDKPSIQAANSRLTT